MKIRSFLAFDMPPVVKQTLGALIADLRRMGPDLKWAVPEQLHVTLRFFGAVEESLLSGAIATAIRGVTATERPHAVHCAGLGVFPNWKYPRVIWAGFAGDTEPVIALHDRLAKALENFPLKPDERVFRLHLTIARAKGHPPPALVKTVESLGPIEFGKVPIDQLTLYKSQLTRSGSIYTPLVELAFTGAHVAPSTGKAGGASPSTPPCGCNKQ
ncbi:MAG: RNA 2',3'-cyclic phosphodiesterase [Deltaproteobacteria bacterium]|nr:RNA 2',3'-cyclic phosphodiesterase [Deltaproteobacteria bacterium]